MARKCEAGSEVLEIMTVRKPILVRNDLLESDGSKDEPYALQSEERFFTVLGMDLHRMTEMIPKILVQNSDGGNGGI